MAYGHITEGHWPLADIIYVAFIAPVMVAAFLEWFLFLAAFLYCLCKVYTKADTYSVKILAVVMMILFTALRSIFLPVMIVTLPMPNAVTRHFPVHAVTFLQWFAFWTFAVLLIVPWLFCVYRLVTYSLGRKRLIKDALNDVTAPKTVIVMPVYREDPEVLITAIDSVVSSDYPSSCIHVFLSYDGGQVDEDYLKLVGHLGVPVTLNAFPTSIDVTYQGARITISRFKHGGKRHCQQLTFRLIDKVYEKYLQKNDNLFLLFIDSDCILDRYCLLNFMYDMELKPNSGDMIGMTGVITSTTKKNSLITILQDMEYVHGQLFERSVESGCGAVTCLPGALTMLRFSAFKKVARFYFSEKAAQCEDLFDFGKCHLGEDRWLTHLFMIGAKKRFQIQMCTNAFCKTEAVQEFRSLLKQRRRWFLGFITNEACMLTDVRVWYRYPVLCIVRLMQNTIRTTALLFFIMVISVVTTSNKVQNLPVGFIGVSLGLNYLLMIYFGGKLRRYKAWLYPLMFLMNPFFNWLYMVYGIFTAGQRTWGGPRADAAKADVETPPEEADIETKGESGKERASETSSSSPNTFISLASFDEHFDNVSDYTLPYNIQRNPGLPPLPLHPPDPWETGEGELSSNTSEAVSMPLTVRDIMRGESQQSRLQKRPDGSPHSRSSSDPSLHALILASNSQFGSDERIASSPSCPSSPLRSNTPCPAKAYTPQSILPRVRSDMYQHLEASSSNVSLGKPQTPRQIRPSFQSRYHNALNEAIMKLDQSYGKDGLSGPGNTGGGGGVVSSSQSAMASTGRVNEILTEEPQQEPSSRQVSHSSRRAKVEGDIV